MKIMLVTAGSRGDVEPFRALARHARVRGHDVQLGVPAESGLGVADPHFSLEADFAGLVAGQGVSPLAAARAMRTVVRPVMARLLAVAARAILDQRPDVVVYHPKILSAPGAADAVGAAHVVVETVPVLTRSAAFPMPGTIARSVGPLNPFTYRAGDIAAGMFRHELAAALRPAGPSTRLRASRPAASLLPISPVLLPRPADWPGTAVMTGPWTAEGDTSTEPSVDDFMRRGSFVYAGFGSMAAGDPVVRARMIVRAARSRGLRVLLAAGWGGLDLPEVERADDVLVVPSVPHAVVLPEAEVAIHHGGAGTSHAAVRAGVPSVVVPFVADQPFWARRLQERGFAPPPVSRRLLSARRLGRALDAATARRPAVRDAAPVLRAERGTTRALEVLESLA